MSNIALIKVINEIIKNNSTEMIDGLIEKIEESDEGKKDLFEILKKNDRFALFILINATKLTDTLKEIKNIFSKSKIYIKMKKYIFKHYNINVKKYFLRELGKAKTEIFTEIFMDSLKSRDWEIRREIAEILSKYNDDESLNVLMTMIDDYDRRVVKDTILYLAEKGDRVLLFVDKYVEMPIERAKINLLELFNQLESVGSLKYIIRLCGDTSERVRIEAQKLALYVLEKNSPEKDIDGYKTILYLLGQELKKIDVQNSAAIVKIILKFKDEGARIVEEDMEEKWADIDTYKRILFEIKGEDKVYIIKRMLLSKKTDIRKKGLEILYLADIKHELEDNVLKIIVDYLTNDEIEISEEERESIRALLLKTRLFEKIVQKVVSQNLKERRSAVISIGIVSDESRLYEVVIKLLNDPAKEVRRDVLNVLVRSLKEEYLSYFETMLQDPEEIIQIEALRAIAKYDNPASKHIIIKSMGHSNQNVREEAVKIIARDSLKHYIDSFHTLDEINRKRVGVLIEKMGEKTEEILYDEINSTNFEIRERVIEILKYIKDKYKFKEVMKKAIKDPDKKIRSSVVKFLVNISDRELLLSFVQLLNDPDKRVRANAIEAFGTVESDFGKQVIQLLYQFLKDEDNRIRANAIMAIYRLGDKQAAEELNEMLISESELMRASGVYAIGALILKEKRKFIIGLMNDQSIMVRKNIIITLSKLGEEENIEKFLNDESEDVRAVAKKYLKRV